MSGRSILLAVFALSFSSAACQAPTPEAGPLSDDDVAAIISLRDRWVQAELEGDWDAWATLLTEDAVQMPPNHSAIEGRTAIKAWAETFPTITDVAFTPIETNGRDGLAYIRGTYSITIMAEGMPEPVTDSGSYVQILRKQPDGSWRVAIGIWNSDLPLAEQGSAVEE
jgi:uncharacterized protein (TIGR02246 family)